MRPEARIAFSLFNVFTFSVSVPLVLTVAVQFQSNLRSSDAADGNDGDCVYARLPISAWPFGPAE